MDSVQNPCANVRRFILEAAGHDPRYLLLLPGLFTAPEGNPYPNIADNLDALFIVEKKYPADLQRFFNPCLQLDARRITPFLPYVIRGDLLSLLDVDENPAFALEDVVGNQNSLNDVDPGPGGGASPDREDPSPIPGDAPCDADDLGNLRWNFNTITTTAILAIPMSIILGVLTAYFLRFY